MIEGAAKGATSLDRRATPEEGTDGGLRRALPLVGVVSVSIDAVADCTLRGHQVAAGTTELRCDACDVAMEGQPAGRGLYMWTRGEEIRFEEPALCRRCATAIGVTALSLWSVEEEEG